MVYQRILGSLFVAKAMIFSANIFAAPTSLPDTILIEYTSCKSMSWSPNGQLSINTSQLDDSDKYNKFVLVKNQYVKYFYGNDGSMYKQNYPYSVNDYVGGNFSIGSKQFI